MTLLFKNSKANAITESNFKTHVEGIIDSKLRTAVDFANSGTRDEGGHSWFKSVLESKAMQEIGNVIDAKQYRRWNKK